MPANMNACDWAERIGWKRFFELTGLPFTEHLIDDFPGSCLLYLASEHAVQILAMFGDGFAPARLINRKQENSHGWRRYFRKKKCHR